jgi:hypothetical protein
MSPIEWRGITPEEMIQDIENAVRQQRENKYAFQTGLKDLDFDINHDLLTVLGLTLPFSSIDQAEQALVSKAILPVEFVEYDDTRHVVIAFDTRPVGFSGCMDCVTHSLALTNLGLFEVGRYPAINLSGANRYWQWFLHRRLALPQEVDDWCESQDISAEQYLADVYQALIPGYSPS